MLPDLSIEEELDLIEEEERYQQTLDLLRIEVEKLGRELKGCWNSKRSIRSVNWLKEGF